VQILSFKSTCYARRPGVRTPSPVCDASVMNFKNELLQRVPGTFSPQVLLFFHVLFVNGLYFFLSIINCSPCSHWKISPICIRSMLLLLQMRCHLCMLKVLLLISLTTFYQRAQKDKSNDNRRSTNSAEATCSTPCSNIFAAGNNTGDDNGLHFDYHYDNVAGDSPVQTPEDNGHHTDDHHDNVVGDHPVEAADVNVQHSDDHDDIVVGIFLIKEQMTMVNILMSRLIMWLVILLCK